MRVPCLQQKSVASVTSAQAKSSSCFKSKSVRTLNTARLKGHRGRRSLSAGGSGFGGVWMLFDRERERTGTGLFPVVLLARPTAVPNECEEIKLERRETWVTREINFCLQRKTAFVSGRMQNI